VTFVLLENGNQNKMLTAKQEKIATIASFTAVSDTVNLAKELHAGLDAGLTINEIKEIFIQLCMYCGFPRGIRGIDIFMEVLAERKSKEINDPEGPSPSPVSDNRQKYDRGEEVHVNVTGLTKEQLRFGAMAFIPKIDVQLKEYIFCDVYESDLLSWSDREIATVSALLSMNDIAPQIQFHINTAFHIGLTEAQIGHLISLIENAFGPATGNLGRTLLAHVMSARNDK
jgi:alkylhydroperoxidase/carboxymuconolactone decarboxylase family protein YurZ